MREFTVTDEIDVPSGREIELFDNSDNLPKRNNGTQNYEHLNLAIERGLNYLDMAPQYGRGDCETAYGKLLASSAKRCSVKPVSRNRNPPVHSSSTAAPPPSTIRAPEPC